MPRRNEGLGLMKPLQFVHWPSWLAFRVRVDSLTEYPRPKTFRSYVACCCVHHAVSVRALATDLAAVLCYAAPLGSSPDLLQLLLES
jgi:hypothetical protein